MERILATSPAIPGSMAENGGLVSDGTPRMGITMETAESVYYTLSPTWRTARIHPTLSPAEKLEYYKTYDPMTGVKIAASLSGFLTMAVLYVFYKVGDVNLCLLETPLLFNWRVSLVIPHPISRLRSHGLYKLMMSMLNAHLDTSIADDEFNQDAEHLSRYIQFAPSFTGAPNEEETKFRF